jgi:hypothetical protein
MAAIDALYDLYYDIANLDFYVNLPTYVIPHYKMIKFYYYEPDSTFYA